MAGYERDEKMLAEIAEMGLVAAAEGNVDAIGKAVDLFAAATYKGESLTGELVCLFLGIPLDADPVFIINELMKVQSHPIMKGLAPDQRAQLVSGAAGLIDLIMYS